MTILLVQTAAVWFMTGTIWTMQVLNYPLLAKVGTDAVPAYETAHNRRFIGVVGPPTAVAVVTTVLLLTVGPDELGWVGPVAAAVLLVVVIVSTARFQAPAHGRLAQGFDAATHAGLVRGNWVRTAAWTLLGLVDLAMLVQLASGVTA